MHKPTLFDSFFLGGFECSTHRREDGRRLDLIASTAHDRHVAADYAALREHGIRSVRDGLRWHLIEKANGDYDWSSVLPMLRAANDGGTQVSWDLCHYGWPDHLDIWAPNFVERFARFVGAFARLVKDEGGPVPFYCPINEISYWAWAGGDMSRFWPLGKRRGGELKRQLVRASIAAIDAIREAEPRARILAVDPVINVVTANPDRREEARGAHDAQFEAWDMLCGRQAPELGGRADTLDVVGVNYYSDNQWVLDGATIGRGDKRYKPLRQILFETHQRYDRPILIAETGAEGDERAPWLQYVADEVLAALGEGTPIEGICLYPVLDYPGWINERVCETGLLGYADAQGLRPVHRELAQQLAFQTARFEVRDAGALEARREAVW